MSSKTTRDEKRTANEPAGCEYQFADCSATETVKLTTEYGERELCERHVLAFFGELETPELTEEEA